MRNFLFCNLFKEIKDFGLWIVFFLYLCYPTFTHQNRKEIPIMLEYRYDTQLLIEGEDLDEDEIHDYFTDHFKGDCLLAVGDEDLIKIHYHTNEPWKVLEYCSTLGEIFDIVVEDMDRQERGLKG